MNNRFLLVSVVVVVFLVASVISSNARGSSRNSRMTAADAGGSDGSDEMSGNLLDWTLKRKANHQPRREKRRLQDVEKLMIEDEVLSYLVCDVCEKHKCELKYCRFCNQCVFKFPGKKNSFFYSLK